MDAHIIRGDHTQWSGQYLHPLLPILVSNDTGITDQF